MNQSLAGNKHFGQLIRKDVTGGLTFLYIRTRDDLYILIGGRAQFLRWIPAKSPMLIQTLQICQGFLRVPGEKQGLLFLGLLCMT